MKRELKHDILAEKIWERLPEQDKLLRQVRRSIAQRAADYFSGKGSLAGEPELVNWKALSERLRLEEQEKQFVELSWQDVRAKKAEEAQRLAELEEQARREKQLRQGAEQAQRKAEENEKIAAANARQAKRRTRVAFILALLAGVALVFAILKSKEANTQTNEARVQTEIATEKAAEAERERIEADTARAEALRAKQSAQDSALYARQQEAIAQEALRQSQITAGRTVPVLLGEADNYILALKYDDALVRAKAAWDLNADRPKVARCFQEIAFFFTESGAYNKAANTLAYIGRKPKRVDRAGLLEAIEKIDRLYLKEALEKKYYPEMVPVEGGDFTMGCDTAQYFEAFNDKEWVKDELPQHSVTLKSFRIARTETTVWQYYLYTVSTNQPMPKTPSWQWKGNEPIVNVSWYYAVAYANWLSRQLNKEPFYQLDIPSEPNDLWGLDRKDSINWQSNVKWTANGFRLPTEAEWEYAAWGGKKTKGYIFAGGDTADLVGWYSANNDPYGAKPVKGKLPNELGLYDMSGNVWEWCWDWYDEKYYKTSPSENPRGPETVGSRVLRGGSWYSGRSYLRSSDRSGIIPSSRSDNYGFRLSQGY